MKKIIYSLLLFTFIGHLSYSQSARLTNAYKIDASFFNEVDDFLQEHISDGAVPYDNLIRNPMLYKLIEKISSADINRLSDDSKQALFINAYNLYVIFKVSQLHPLKSVLDQKDFFDKKDITIANKKISLNELEKEWLLGNYNDPRYHFVLVCGAIDCPPITNFAYTPDELDSQLERQTKKAINNASFIRTNNGQVQLSEIFKWYADDFGGSNKKVLKFINRYRKNKINTDSPINYYNYDWNLNTSK